MSYILNGVLKNGYKIGNAKVVSTELLTKGHMVPYEKFNPTSITVHETDCPDVPATQFYKSVKNGQNDLNRKQDSFQLCVDAYTIRQLVNLYRTCWHAGCKEGNNTSIGIEICQYSNNKELQKQAYLNAIELIKVLKSEITTVKKVKRHYDWTKKICPSYMITKKYSGLTWDWFASRLEKEETYVQLKNGVYNKKYKVITNALNVRKDRPDKDGNLAAKSWVLKEGDIIEVGYVYNGWGSIWSEGDVGYINTSSKYIEAFN